MFCFLLDSDSNIWFEFDFFLFGNRFLQKVDFLFFWLFLIFRSRIHRSILFTISSCLLRHPLLSFIMSHLPPFLPIKPSALTDLRSKQASPPLLHLDTVGLSAWDTTILDSDDLAGLWNGESFFPQPAHIPSCSSLSTFSHFSFYKMQKVTLRWLSSRKHHLETLAKGEASCLRRQT